MSWVGVCRWNSETLTRNQTMFSCILQPYSRVETRNPYPIPTLSLSHFPETLSVMKVAIKVAVITWSANDLIFIFKKIHL